MKSDYTVYKVIALLVFAGYIGFASLDAGVQSKAPHQNLMSLVQTNHSRLFGPHNKQAPVLQRMLDEEQLMVHAKLGETTLYAPRLEMTFLGRRVQLIEIHPFELMLMLDRSEHQDLAKAHSAALQELHCSAEVPPEREAQIEFVFCE